VYSRARARARAVVWEISARERRMHPRSRPRRGVICISSPRCTKNGVCAPVGAPLRLSALSPSECRCAPASLSPGPLSMPRPPRRRSHRRHRRRPLHCRRHRRCPRVVVIIVVIVVVDVATARIRRRDRAPSAPLALVGHGERAGEGKKPRYRWHLRPPRFGAPLPPFARISASRSLLAGGFFPSSSSPFSFLHRAPLSNPPPRSFDRLRLSFPAVRLDIYIYIYGFVYTRTRIIARTCERASVAILRESLAFSYFFRLFFVSRTRFDRSDAHVVIVLSEFFDRMRWLRFEEPCGVLDRVF